MKKILFISVLSLTVLKPVTTFSQKVEDVLKMNYAAFDTTRVYAKQLAAVNKFKLIAQKWPDTWQTNFYAAWSLAVLTFTEPDKDKVDPMLDEADKFYAKISSMDSTNDEVNVLGALLSSARIGVNPMQRWQKYGAMTDKFEAKALSINPNNPRVYYLKANATMFTPEAFGGGADKAMPLYLKAESLFPKDSQDIMSPHWGKNACDYMLKMCKEKMSSK